MALRSWANYLMRNNSAEYVSSTMGLSFVQYPRVLGCMDVVFNALVRRIQPDCRFSRIGAWSSMVKYGL